MNTQLIPVFAGELSGVPVQLVDARLLHSFLEVATQFKDWIARRIEEYGFIDDQDFRSFLSGTKGRPAKDYHLNLDMAKELSMVERNEKGKQARRYFIDCERRLLQDKPNPIEAFQTRILVCIEKGEITQQTVPFDACVVSGGNAQQLSTFLRECVPFELVPVVLESATQRLGASHQASFNTAQPPSVRQIIPSAAQAPTATLSLADQFIQDWKSEDKPVINAPFIPCLGTQVLRLFHVWAQNKGIAVRLGDNYIMSDLYQHPGFYKNRMRISNAANANPRTVLMIEGITSPSGITVTDWIADCIDRIEDALIWMEIP
jgi:phage anti-repressor protein